jgi:flagellar basal-body rod modification protein FlgD
MEVAGIRSAAELQGESAGGNGPEELGKTQFLELMIAQMNNQNPLDPDKNEDFIAQLAQLSTVEGIENLNNSVADMNTALQSTLTMEAASLVGRFVVVPTNQSILQGSGLGGTIDVSSATGNLRVEITTATGAPVRQIDLGPQASGPIRFAWDGRTDAGEASPQGVYRVHAYSEFEDQRREFAVNMPDQVVSVSIGDQGVMANLASGASVSTQKINEIM